MGLDPVAMMAPMRLLAVDDEPAVVELLQAYFEAAGYQVRTALDGAAALAALAREPADVVLLDVNMPGMNGLEVLRRIRETGAAGHVIVISGSGDPALTRRAQELGAFAYVAKPFTLEHMSRFVAAACNDPARSATGPTRP